MYRKIVNHYKQYIQKQNNNQNEEGTGQNEQTTDQETNEAEPIAGPSGLQRQNEVDSTIHQQAEKDKMINFEPSFSAIKVFENKNIEVFVQKSLHKRLKTFKMEDSVFHVKITVKDNQTPPLLKDLLVVFEKVFTFILSNIRTFFKEDEENIVYMTLMQSPMVNGLNSAGFHLQDNSSDEIVDQILNMLQRFLISDNNIDLHINDTFKVFVHVLSINHVQFKKRYPRAKQKNTRKKHYGNSTDKNVSKYVWAIDISDGYDSNPNAFKNKCFIMCSILGHLQNSYFKSERLDKRFYYAKMINNKSKNLRIHAGNILKKELDIVLKKIEFNEDEIFNLEQMAKKMSDLYQCQIFLFDGIENSSKLKYMYPATLQDNLEPIYLYEPFDNEHHVILIKNLNSYFKANKKVCFQCKKTFKDSRYLHRCIRKSTCFACRRRFKSHTTYTHEIIEKQYCDTKVNPSIEKSICNICNVFLKTDHCKKGHKLLCNGKGRFGWKCLKCKRFTCRHNNTTSEELKKSHKCGEEICNFCKEYYNPKDCQEIHLCRLTPETITNKWPALAFMRFEFLNINSENCAKCFEMKLKFQIDNNITLKDVYEHERFPDLFCDIHSHFQNDIEPNLLVLYKENKVKRGFFTRHVLSSFSVDDKTQDVLSFDYLKDIKGPSCFVKKHKLKSFDLKQKLAQLEQKDISNSIILQFFALIFSDEWSNTTFILQDEDSITLVSKQNTKIKSFHML